MVRNGYAVAYKRYSKDYVRDEEYAKENKLGVWEGSYNARKVEKAELIFSINEQVIHLKKIIFSCILLLISCSSFKKYSK